MVDGHLSIYKPYIDLTANKSYSFGKGLQGGLDVLRLLEPKRMIEILHEVPVHAVQLRVGYTGMCHFYNVHSLAVKHFLFGLTTEAMIKECWGRVNESQQG
ncbi:MAG: hypothetical protein BGO31_00035 [Bacteroidetes bacterium 43-16]|nr:MAG: hypothetical protein BGO31_00035 [Bacteroidetes bacterium 43-16]